MLQLIGRPVILQIAPGTATQGCLLQRPRSRIDEAILAVADPAEGQGRNIGIAELALTKSM